MNLDGAVGDARKRVEPTDLNQQPMYRPICRCALHLALVAHPLVTKVAPPEVGRD